MRKKYLYICIFPLLFASFAPLTAEEGWQWQDPLDFKTIDVADKYLLLYSLAGVSLSLLLSKAGGDSVESYLSFYSEYHHEYDARRPISDVFIGKSRITFPLRRWIDMGGEVQIYKMKDALVSAVGAGGAIVFNWKLIRRGTWQLYFDNGSGILYTSRNFPNGGTKFNFHTFYGLSADVQVKREVLLQLGVRNMHISNAFLFGDDNNPAFDSVGFQVGFKFSNPAK